MQHLLGSAAIHLKIEEGETSKHSPLVVMWDVTERTAEIADGISTG
jgi:hypothetical protein